MTIGCRATRSETYGVNDSAKNPVPILPERRWSPSTVADGAPEWSPWFDCPVPGTSTPRGAESIDLDQTGASESWVVAADGVLVHAPSYRRGRDDGTADIDTPLWVVVGVMLASALVGWIAHGLIFPW